MSISADRSVPKVAKSGGRNHPPAVPAVPQLARISLLTHLYLGTCTCNITIVWC